MQEENQQGPTNAAPPPPPTGDTETLYRTDAERGYIEMAPDDQPDEVVSWEASEYIHHEKNFGWFLALAIIGFAIAAILYMVVDLMSAIVVFIMTIALIVYANRPPRTLRYTLSNQGLTIGDREFALTEFSSFGVVMDGALPSVVMQPIKRFMPPISLYVSEQDADQIIDILNEYLPHEDKELDFIDKLVRKLRF